MTHPFCPFPITDESGTHIGIVDNISSPRVAVFRVTGWTRSEVSPFVQLRTSASDQLAPSSIVRTARPDVVQAGAAVHLENGFRADFLMGAEEVPLSLRVGYGEAVTIAGYVDGASHLETSSADYAGPPPESDLSNPRSGDLAKEASKTTRTERRRHKLLGAVDIATMTGVEIGALDKPVVEKSVGSIFYVDYADEDFLKDRYRVDPNVDVDRIVEIDGIWGLNTLVECLGAVAPVDYIVASHVIEHVPDLVSWLHELRSILKPDGRVCLAIPDRRFSFDFHRKETGIAEVLSNHYFHRRTPTVQQVTDHILNLVPVDTASLWRSEVPPLPTMDPNGMAGILDLADDIVLNGTYHDVHCWIFTPRSLALLFIALAQLGLLRFECDTFHDTEVDELEFFVTLKASDERDRTIESWRGVVSMVGGQDNPRSGAMIAQVTESAIGDQPG